MRVDYRIGCGQQKSLLLIGPLLCVLFGIGVGYFLFNGNSTHANNIDDADMSSYWEVWKTLNDKYPFEAPTNKKRVEASIQGLVAAYNDPHMHYFTKDEYKTFTQDIHGEFSGIGVEFTVKNNLLTVIAPIKDSPADIAGIKSGDIVTKIDGFVSADLTVDEAVQKIRGEKGTTVTLLVARKGAKDFISIPIIRDIIKVPNIETEVINKNIYHISLFTFDENSVGQVKDALQTALKNKDSKIILDLRGNPGGYLEAAIKIASMFLDSNKIVVKEVPGSEGKTENVHYSYGYDIVPKNKIVYILVDQGSASSSEILSGALQDHKRAKLLGEQTFGKGSVQELIDLENGSGVKITIAKWLTPNGTSISEKGLTPDIIIKDTNLYDDTDEVLQKAIKMIQQE